MVKFFKADCPDMYCAYGFCDGNVRDALRNFSISLQIGSNPADALMPPAHIGYATPDVEK
jgi:hypothetical protein